MDRHNCPRLTDSVDRAEERGRARIRRAISPAGRVTGAIRRLRPDSRPVAVALMPDTATAVAAMQKSVPGGGASGIVERGRLWQTGLECARWAMTASVERNIRAANLIDLLFVLLVLQV
jgi:hypothetical protein